jgi:tetratricopeptide (TPR) repeat protein
MGQTLGRPLRSGPAGIYSGERALKAAAKLEPIPGSDAERAHDSTARAQATAQQHLLRAGVLQRSGKHELAEAAAQRAIACEPHCAKAWEMLGTIKAGCGELAESADCFLAAVEIDPHFLQALNNLAVVLQRLGRLDEAATRYRQALVLAPQSADIRLNYATLLGTLGRYREGLTLVDALLATAPPTTKALLLAASMECEIGRDAAALKRIDCILTIEPHTAKILALRARILCRLDRWEAALEDCDRAVARCPADGEALYARALALQGLDRVDEALESFRLAQECSAAPAAALVDGAWLLAEMGRKDEALAALERALVIEPRLSTAWYARSKLKRHLPGDIAIMETMADDPATSHRDRMYFDFAIGNAHLELGCGEQAFGRLDAANRSKRQTLAYDPGTDEARFAEIAALYSADNLARLAGSGDPSRRPIFVFGMPRSGTTLVEQILASHPCVYGAGEPAHLRDIAETPGFSQVLLQSTPEERAALGRRYLAHAGTCDAPHFVDKMPLNFLHAGLISLTLPGARMIHCRRDPLDTCLSIYALLFSSGHPFAYDQGELGRTYNLYRAVMEHWRRALAPGSLLEIDYESLVRGTEDEVRRLLDFCDLPWDARCLDFHRTNRRVSSSSLTQVRSPIYTASLGRAQEFRPWLGTLENALSAPFPGIAVT